MKTMNDTPFAIGTMAARIEPAANARTVIVKGTFDLNHGKIATLAKDQAQLSADRYWDDDLSSTGS